MDNNHNKKEQKNKKKTKKKKKKKKTQDDNPTSVSRQLCANHMAKMWMEIFLRFLSYIKILSIVLHVFTPCFRIMLLLESMQIKYKYGQKIVKIAWKPNLKKKTNKKKKKKKKNEKKKKKKNNKKKTTTTKKHTHTQKTNKQKKKKKKQTKKQTVWSTLHIRDFRLLL